MTRTRQKTEAAAPKARAGRRTPAGSSTDPALDPVTYYAEEVAAGRIVAGPHVRGACKRHLKDLVDGEERGIFWDLPAAIRVFEFFREVLTVLKDGDTVAFELELAQKFIVGSIFGWKRVHADGKARRRFRTAYIETAKGSGKSPMAGGIGLYCMTADKEARSEVYSAATKKDQAQILFQDAVAMYENSPVLMSRLVPSGRNPVYRLSHPRSGGIFKPISSDDGQSGPRPSCALVDEVHEHKDASVINMLRAGFKFRTQPLLILITNSGHDVKSVCYEFHERAARVCAGQEQDDSFFAYVCALDEGDDPFTDESCWPKANPTLGATISWDYLREQVDEARKLPSTQNTCLRLNFCVWTDAESAWMTRAAWSAAEIKPQDDVRLEDFRGAECFLASDLSFSRDLTALAAVFPDGDDLYAFVDFWTPLDTISEREDQDRVPYTRWAALGHFADQPRYLTATPGVVVALSAVARRLAWFDENFDVQGYAYDRYRHKDLANQLADEEDLEHLVRVMIEHPQGFRRVSGPLLDHRGRPVLGADGKPLENPLWMPSSVEALENGILEAGAEQRTAGRLFIAPNPVLRWNAAGAVVRMDPAGTGGKVFSKLKAKGRIDGVVALAMAVGLARAPKPKRSSINGFLSSPVVAI